MNSDWEKWPFYGSLSLLPSPWPLTPPWLAPRYPGCGLLSGGPPTPALQPASRPRPSAHMILTQGAWGQQRRKRALSSFVPSHACTRTHTAHRVTRGGGDASPGCKISAPRPAPSTSQFSTEFSKCWPNYSVPSGVLSQSSTQHALTRGPDARAVSLCTLHTRVHTHTGLSPWALPLHPLQCVPLCL